MNKSDAVVFNINKVPISINATKRHGQKWINLVNGPIDGENYDFIKTHENSFDWSASYESDSDFLSIAYKTLNLTWNIHESLDFDIPNVNKKNLVATLINDCVEYERHSKFINLLRKQLDVDVYGECGKPCGESKKSLNSITNFYPFYPRLTRSYYENEHKCLSFIEKHYKFFIVLEEKICTNYKSERFFNILKYDIVPIVFAKVKFYRSE